MIFGLAIAEMESYCLMQKENLKKKDENKKN
jgi:hypothetical protein